MATVTRRLDPLRVRCFGDFRVETEHSTIALPISGKTRELLAYLVCNAERPIRRASLSGVIWTDHEDRRSRSNLNTALWRINRALESAGVTGIDLEVTPSQIALRLDPSVFVDVFALETAVREALGGSPEGRKATLSAGLRKALLEVFAPECEALLRGLESEWVLIERERLFNLQIRGLTLLMQDLAESGRIEGALEQGRRVLRMDPMRECVQRQVMWLHVLNGHQGNAIRQYLECARILKDELGVAPMPETRVLYEYIRSQNGVASTDALAASRPVSRQPGSAGGRPLDDDEDLSRLRSLLSQLNSHRHSVFSALSDIGVI
jgi:DNA-binding SARP family transcriptional activator